MATVIATATLGEQQVTYNGTLSTNLYFRLQKAGANVQTQTVPMASPTATFNSVGDGTYTVSVSRILSNGAAIGTPAVSASFTVSNSVSELILVPVGASASVSEE